MNPNNNLESYHWVLTALVKVIITYLIINNTWWKRIEESYFQCYNFSAAFLLWYWVKPWRYISSEFYWQITFIIYVPVLSRVWDVIRIKTLHVVFLLEPLAHTTLTYCVWFPKSKTMHLVTPREKPSYGISDLYKQWPQKQESNGNYPQLSLPSAAPGEPPNSFQHT